MAPVLGEPLVHRTLRLFRERCSEPDQVVVLRRDAEPLGILEVAEFRISRKETDESYKLTSSAPMWTRSPIVSVFGDVFFTEAAVDRIVDLKVQDFEWFGRRRGNRYTGSKSGEIFGVKFPASRGHKLLKAAKRVREMRANGAAMQTKAWEIYRLLNNMSLVKLGMQRGQRKIKPPPTWETGPHFHEIDDLTDDFDKPSDYEGWKAAVEQNALLAVG
jgi:hypothetical protein